MKFCERVAESLNEQDESRVLYSDWLLMIRIEKKNFLTNNYCDCMGSRNKQWFISLYFILSYFKILTSQELEKK